MDIFETLKAGATEVAHEARNRVLRAARYVNVLRSL